MADSLEFESEDYTAIAFEASERVISEADEVQRDSYSAREDSFEPEEGLSYDVFDAASRPGLTVEEDAEVQAGLMARHRYHLAEKQMLETNKVISESSVVAEQTRLNFSKRDTITEQVANESKRLLQEVERGKLIDQKTIGLALQGVTQQVLNTREFQVIQLEMEKTEAIIEGTIAEITGIRTNTETKVLKAHQAAMKAAGIDVLPAA